MITESMQVALRLLARVMGRAVPARATSAIMIEADAVFGIALVRYVGEDLVQSLAFGQMDQVPVVTTCWQPLSRDYSLFEPLSEALDTYLTAMLSSGRCPRIWLPNLTTLKVLETMAARIRSSDRPVLQRLGWQLRELINEANFDGQQVVVTATELLAQHVATGQPPERDRHPGTLLA